MDENLNDSDILKKTDSIQVSSQVDETSPETVSNSKSFPETELEERAQPTKQAKDDSESGLDLQERADVVMTEDKEGACSNSTHCSIERPKKEKNLSKTDSVFILSSDDEKEAGDSTKESDRPITESEVDMFSSHLNDTQVQMQSESMDYGDMIPSSQEDSAEDVSSAHISNKRLDDGTSRIPQGKRKLENVDEPECKMLCVEKHPSPNEQRTPAQFPKSDVTSHRKEADSNTDFEPAIRKNSKVIEESESEDDMSDRKDDSKNFSEDMETIEKDKTMKKSYKIHLLHEINAEKGNTRDEKISLNVADDKTGLTNVDNQAISAVNNVSGAEIAGEGSLSGKTLSNTQMLNTNKCESKQFQLNFDPKTKINSDSPSLLGDAKLDTSETYDDTQDILEFNNKISNVADMDSTELDNSPVMTESDMFAPDEVMETDVSEHGRSSASVADTVVQTDMAQSESKGKSNTDDCVETEMPKLNLGTKSVSLSQNVELDVLELDNKCNVLNLNEVTLSKSHVCADSTSKSEDTSEGSKTSQLNAVISEALKVEKGISETSKEDDVTSEAFKLCDALPKAIKTDNKTEVTQPEGVIPKVSKYNVSKSEFEGSQSKDTILEYSKSVLVSEASKLEDDTGPTKLETVVLYSSKSDDISNSGKSENVPDTGSSESASGEGKSDVSSSDDTVITHSSQSSDMRPCDQKSDHINYADITKSDLEKTAFKNSDKLGTDLLNSSELKSKLSELNEVSSDSSAKYNTVKLDNAKNLKLSESSLLVEEVTVEPEVVAQKSKKYLEDKRVFSEKYSSSPIKHVEVNFVHPKTTPSKSSKYLGRVIEDDEFDADGSRKSNDLDVSDSQDLTLCISLSPNTSTQSADDVQLEKRSLKSQYSQHDKEMDIVEVSPETLKERKSEEQNSKLPTFEKASSDSILSNGFADTHEVMVCCSSDNKISDLDSTASRNSIVIIRERDNCPVRKKEDTSTSPVKRKRLNDNSDVIELVDITETPPQPEDTHHKKKLRTLENEEKMSFTSPELSIMETNTSSIDVAESSFENEAISLSGKAAALKDDTTIMYRKEDITCKMKIVYKKHTKEVLSATVVQCELKGDQFRVPRRSSDLSPGYMADSDGKTSPGSVTSTGPYALIPKQMSRFSTVSSSSSGSNFGSFNGNGEPPKDCNTFKLPPVEKMKERYLFRDDNLEKNGHQIFSTPGSLTRNYNLMIQILDQIAVVDNFNISDSGYNEDYESKKSGSNFTDTNGHSKTERDVKPFAAENGTPKSTRKSQVRVAKQSVSKVKVISDSKEEKSPSVVDSGEKPVDSDLAARSPQVGRSGRRARNNLDLEARRSPAQSATRSKTPGSSDRKAAHSGTGRRKTGSEKGSLETQAVENPKMPEVYEKPSRPETPKKDSVSSEPRTPEAIDGVRGDQIESGASVFARWTDRKYYSGKVKNKVQRDKWLVEFDDGNSKPLIQDFIIVCTELNRGQSVYAMNRHGEFLSGVIKDFKLSKGEVVYGVELDDTEEQLFVPRSKISLSEDQASLLRESVYDTSFTCLTPKSLSAVTLDNLVEGKRVRKLQAHLERPQTSGTLSNLKPRRARSDASSLSDAGDKASSASEFVEGVDPESYPSVELVVTKGKRKSKPKVSEGHNMASKLRKTTFRDEWNQNPSLSWAQAIDGSPFAAWCKLCNHRIELSNMGKQALTSHASGVKHSRRVQGFHMSSSIAVYCKTTRPTSAASQNNSASESSSPLSESSKLFSSDVPSSPQVSSPPLFQTDPVSSSKSLPDTSSNADNSYLNPSATCSCTCTCGSARKESKSLTNYLLNDSVTRAEILWCLYCGMAHNSLRNAENSVAMHRKMYHDSKIAAKLQLGKSKVSYTIVHGLAPEFQKELHADISKSSHLVVGFDESLNKIAQKQQMDISVRYWNEDDSITCTRYLTSAFLGHSTAADLLSAFKNSLPVNTLHKIIQVSMDGLNVNLRFLKDLKQDLKEGRTDEGVILDIGTCGLHSLHCAFKGAMKETGWEIVKFLRAIYNLFHNIPTRRADYIRIFGSSLFPLKFCPVRWLDNVPVADRALKFYQIFGTMLLV